MSNNIRQPTHEIVPADLHTIRDLIRAFEEHLSQEAHALGVTVETLCPCGGDEIKAARELLGRLDPFLEV